MDVEANVGDDEPLAQKQAMAAGLMDEDVGSVVIPDGIIKEGVVEKKGHSAAFMMWPR